MYCPKCGRENPEQAKFCGACGTSLQKTEQPEIPKHPEIHPASTGEAKQEKSAGGRKPQKHRGMKWLIVILAVVLIIVIILNVLLWLFSGEITDSAAVDERETAESSSETGDSQKTIDSGSTNPPGVEETNIVVENDDAAESSCERDESLVTVDSGNMTLLDLTCMDLTATDSDEALAALDSLTGVLAIDSASEELVLKNESSFSGSSYYRFQQIYNNLTVVGRGIVLSASEDGDVQLLTENLADMSRAETEASIDYDEAMDVAVEYLDAQAAETGDEDYESPQEMTMRLCYYVAYDEAVLAWAVSANTSTVYVNANTGDVLGTQEDTSFLTGYNSDGTIEVPAELDDEGMYFIYDEERSLTVYTWDGSNSKGNGSASVLSSDDLYFGNTEEEEDLEYETGIAWYRLLCEVYDFYLDNYGEDGFGSTILCYNDGYDFGGNALGGLYEYETDEYANYLSIGSGWNNVIDDCGDVMAHEFTHAITKAIIGTGFADGAEAEALNEGLSDIMGVLIDASITGGDPDWAIEFDYDSLGLDLLTYFDDRYAYDPEVSSYDDFKASDDSHDSGTLIFYCAWLMWEASGDGLEAIDDINTLAELWYRTILLLNSDATFADCRIACEAAAVQMQELGLLTGDQVNAVIYAFDTCRIQYAADTDLTTDKSLIVTVYDGDKNETDDYHCIITEQNGDVTDEFDGSDIGSAFQVDFNEEGIYRITVSYDTYDYPSVTALVTVGSESLFKLASLTDAELDIYTTFGTNITGTVSDESGQMLDNVNVTAEGTSGYSYSTSSADGSYILYLPVGSYEVTYELSGYDTVTVQQDIAIGTNQADAVVLNKSSEETDYEEDLELYAEILDLFYYGISSQWEDYWENFGSDSEEASVSYLWYWPYAEDCSLSDAGFALIDLDSDGISELLVSQISEDGSSYIRDLYACRDGEIIHLASSGERFEYWLCTDSSSEYLIGYSGSGGAAYHHYEFYTLNPSAEDLTALASISWEDDIISYEGNTISYEEMQTILDSYEDIFFDLRPFSEYTPAGESTFTEEAADSDTVRKELMDFVEVGAYIDSISIDLSETGLYNSFDELLEIGYKPFYTINDLNADGYDELLICVDEKGTGFYFTWTFVYSGGEVILIDTCYGYGQYRYSVAYNAVIISNETRPNIYNNAAVFYQIEKTEFNWLFSIVYDMGTWYYHDSSGMSTMDTTFSESEYSQDISYLEWISLGSDN